MARRTARRKKSRRTLIRSIRLPRIDLSELEQSHLDAIGLGLVGLGAFFSLVLYFGWNGGQIGEVFADAFVLIFGKVAYLLPFVLLAAGTAVIFHPLMPSVPPLRTGAVLFLLALALGLAAGSLGLGPDHPARHGYFDAGFMKHHGGLLGELLYF